MSTPFIGEIRIFGFNYAPVGWALCNGQMLAISQYTALFSLLGTTYGGNGVSTFQLPNLQSRVPLHFGTGLGLSTYNMGEEGGVENVTLLYNQMPVHNHLIEVDANASGKNTPSGSILGTVPPLAPAENKIYSGNAANATMSPAAVSTAGGNLPHNNLQPFLAVNYCIALEGIFPSRG